MTEEELAKAMLAHESKASDERARRAEVEAKRIALPKPKQREAACDKRAIKGRSSRVNS